MNLEGVEWMSQEKAPAQEIFPGIYKRLLWQGQNGAKALTLEMNPGSRFAELDVHEPGPEEVYVVSGVFHDGLREYPAGSFIHNPIGSSHIPQTRSGCVLFVFFPEG